jgi:hypothetical protein
MHRRSWFVAVALASVGGWGPAIAPAATPPAAENACGTHGTQVAFFDSPRDAAVRAKAEQKLVFVLHVSGHFEDPQFT